MNNCDCYLDFDFLDDSEIDFDEGSYIPAQDIADGSITTAKLADSAVTTAKIANGSVTDAKLSPSIPLTNTDENGNEVMIETAVSGVVKSVSVPSYDAFTETKGEVDELSTEIATKADINGEYDSMTAGTAKQLLSDSYTENTDPYIFRQVPVRSTREEDCIVGGSLGWNQLVNTSASSVTVPSGHKYISKINGTVSIGASTGTAISVTGGSDMVIDLTALFGTTIADYIYSLEQATAGAGVAWVNRYIDLSVYHEYDAGSIKSVEGLSAHVMRDADSNIIGNYPLDSNVTLRGIPKLDSNNNLVFDGDIYPPSGEINRRYAEHIFTGAENLQRLATSTDGWYAYAYNPSPASASNTAVDFVSDFGEKVVNSAIDQSNITKEYVSHYGVGYRFYLNVSTVAEAQARLAGKTLIYPLAAPTTETAEPYQQIQICDPYGTEEYVTTGVVPVGHQTKYFEDLKGKLEDIPSLPTSDGTYNLQATVSGGKVTYTWVSA